MNQYQIQNAIFKIDGYYIPSKDISAKKEFENAKSECIEKLLKEIENIRHITFDQFNNSNAAAKHLCSKISERKKAF